MLPWLLVTLVFPLLAACQPGLALRLKTPERFPAEVSRTFLWEDRCGLQEHFDLPLPPHELVSETGIEVSVPGQAKGEQGTTVHRIRHPVQRLMLARLLERYYASAPSLSGHRVVEVQLGYYRYCGMARPLVGSQVRLRLGEQSFTLDYHPCIGEFLLNGDLYAFRRGLLDDGELRVASQSRSIP